MTLRFALLTLALIPLGAWARPLVRQLAWPGRLAIYFACGLLSVVTEMFILSMLGLRWNVWLLVPVPLLLSVVSSRLSVPHRQTAQTTDNRQPMTLLLGALAFATLASASIAAMATSGDYVYFWGVKGQRWGAERFLDTEFTKAPSHYMHPDYPPLLPLYYAWTLLGGDGGFDWWGGIVATPLFLLAGALAMWAFGRYAGVATIDGIVTLFVALYALFYVRNQVAGNAEPPLHMFEAIALAALTCWRERSSEHDWIAAIALSGVALTKVEGGVFVLIVCGVTWLAREGTLVQRLLAGLKMSALPIATLVTWLLFAASHGLTDTYVPRKDLSIGYLWPTMQAYGRELSFHLWYLPWLAFAVILLCGRIRQAIPWLLATALFLLFLLAVYTRPDHHMEWSAGRTLMTPLLLFIAGVVAAHRPAVTDS